MADVDAVMGLPSCNGHLDVPTYLLSARDDISPDRARRHDNKENTNHGDTDKRGVACQVGHLSRLLFDRGTGLGR